MKHEHNHTNGSFSNSLGFILACVGSAVGLGNIWMFPYRLGQYGGAAFLLLYLGFVALFGYVGLSSEFGIGRMARTGAAVMALFSLPLNYFVTYPMYVNVYGLPMEAILGMYNAILPGTDSLLKALVIFNLPFTFFKGMLDVALTFLVYKPLSPVLHGRR